MVHEVPDFGRRRILAIAGSLRAASINAAFCRLLARCAPASMEVTVYPDLGAIPPFNPDLEAAPPVPVLQFRAAVDRADALVIASPEYAHGISGVMKNALDWLVSHEGTIGKPIALINTSPRAHHAYAGISEVLRTMSTELIESASLSIPLLGAHKTEGTMLADEDVSRWTRQVLQAIATHLAGPGSSGPAFRMV